MRQSDEGAESRLLRLWDLSFILSLIETAIELTDGRVSGQQLGELIALARQMITADIELFPGAAEASHRSPRQYPLMLITKGDLLHQRSKLDRFGLQYHFRFVEVVSQDAEVYSAILSGYEVSRYVPDGGQFAAVRYPPRRGRRRLGGVRAGGAHLVA